MLLAAPVAHSQVQLHSALLIEKFLLYSFDISVCTTRFASGVNLFLCDWKNVMYVMHEGSFTLHSALSCLHKPIFLITYSIDESRKLGKRHYIGESS